MNIQSHPEHNFLISAYPNPFNPSINIKFSISKGSNSYISVFDMSGRFLETISQSYYRPGSYTLIWNASDYSSGVYFIRFESDSFLKNKKLLLVK